MEDTRTLITRFREKTLDILNCFNNEDFNRLNELLQDREAIIKIFKENPNIYTKEKISEELKGTNIMQLNDKVKELIVKNMKDIKEKLEDINKDKFVKKKYYSGFSGNSMFFNKKIY